MCKEDTYIVRNATVDDLPDLLALEEQRWSREHVAPVSLQELETWYQSGSPFFLVAEKNGVLAGFYYSICVDFSLDNIEKFAGADVQTNQGYTMHSHETSGESAYAVSVVATAPEVGAVLNAEFHNRMKMMGIRYFIGVSRLVHLDYYLRSIEKNNGGVLPYEEKDVALWYTHESLKMLNTSKMWEECSRQPNLKLPPLRRPDALLKFHVEVANAGLLRIIPNYLIDPKSRNFGALLASEISR